MSKWTRRSFLEGLGVGVAGGSLVPLLDSQRAAAQAFPKRLIVFHMGGGTNMVNWAPRQLNGERLVELGYYHEAFASYMDRTIVFSTLDNPAGSASTIGHGHIHSYATILTGVPTVSGSLKGGAGPGAISIDRAIANQISASAPHTALDFRVRVGGDGESAVSALGPNQPVIPERDPVKMYDRLFTNLSTEPSSNPVDPSQDPLWQRRARILDFLKGQTGTLSKGVSSQDRAKLESHFAALEKLERSLEPVVVESGAGCRKPTVQSSFDLSSNADVPAVGKAQMDMIAMSLACDLTRVATLVWGNHGPGITPVWLGHDIGQHGQAHRAAGPEDSATTQRLANLSTTDEPSAAHHAHMHWYGEQIKYLLDSLAAIPEGDGSVLDNTVLLYTNTHGHNAAVNAALMVAGKNMGMDTGRRLNVAGRTSNEVMAGLANVFGVTPPSALTQSQYFGSAIKL